MMNHWKNPRDLKMKKKNMIQTLKLPPSSKVCRGGDKETAFSKLLILVVIQEDTVENDQ